MNHTTRRFPRTLQEAFPCDASAAVALHSYTQPLHQRLFFAFVRLGWVIVPALLAASVLSGCDDIDAHIATQANLADAVAQAAKEAGNAARP